MSDSYEEFLKNFNIDEEAFYKFGIDSIVFLLDPGKNESEFKEKWEKLKNDVTGNKEAYIRGHGRDGKGTEVYLAFHKELFGNGNIKRDASNNMKARKVIKDLEVGKDIINYQVSHVFGKTRNALLFLAPWNIVLIPKIYDPLSGHEAKGQYSEEFKKIFREKVFEKYQDYIDDYNQLIKKKLNGQSIEEFVRSFVKNVAVKIDPKFNDTKYQEKLIQCLKNDFEPIEKKNFIKN